MYLDRWDYDGEASLGLLIAAPAARNASSDYVVYKKGSPELEANPKWAGPDGNATVESITNFYEVEVDSIKNLMIHNRHDKIDLLKIVKIN